MCLSSPSAPAPPPPPPPPLAPPKRVNESVKKAKVTARQTAALAQGRDGTIGVGALTLDPKNQPRKTLLGG